MEIIGALSAEEPLRQFCRGSVIMIKNRIAIKIGECVENRLREPRLRYVASMNWQQAVSLAIVTSVAGLFLWGQFRPAQIQF